jgi:excisionase family DNA binding protein
MGGQMNDILTRQEVSEKFRLPISTLDYLVSTNQIPFSRIGKRGVRFSLERLNEWFKEREGVEFRHKKIKSG